MSENDKCMICLDTIDDNQDVYSLQCNHKYHTKCIVDWFRSGAKSCPCCNDIPSRFNGLDWPYSSNGEIHQQRIKNIGKLPEGSSERAAAISDAYSDITKDQKVFILKLDIFN